MILSICIPTYNRPEHLLNCLNSLSLQSFKNFEYILIDGKSNDNTLQKIRKYQKKISKILSQKDKGVYFAMNKGIKLAKGEVLIFVNSGDLLTKNALNIIYNKFNKNKELDFVFGTVKRHYTTKTIVKSGYNPFRLKYNFDFATSHSSGFFIKLKSLKKIGNFNTKYRCSSDYDLYYRAIIKKKFIGSSTSKKQLIGIMKSGGLSSKITFIDHLKEETKIRFNNKQNIFFIFFIFFNAIFKNIFKRVI